MKITSMRHNLLALAGLYAISLLAASGCPASRDSQSETSGVVAAIPAPINDDATTVAADHGAAYGDTAKPAFDPVAVNGRFFEGWPKPKLAILITGRQDGYLEPCGCAGLENQKGGLNRRHALVKELRGDGWPLLAIDVGGLVRRYGPQADVQFNVSVEALKIMGYDAVGFGPDDLRLSTGEVLAAVAASPEGESIFPSANVGLFGVDSMLVPRFRIVEVGGLKVGITSVLGTDFQKQVNNSDIEFKDPVQAIEEVLPELENCTLRILLAHATLDESKQLAKRFPEFGMVVSAGGADEPPAEAATVEGTETRLIEVGHKGMFAVVLGLYDDPRDPVRYQRVALDSRYPNTEELHRLMTTYQERLRQLGWEGLGLHPVTHPRAQGGDKSLGEFVGAASCQECHPTAWGIWSKTKHAHATETLAQLDPPRQFDAECVDCHTTGWNPQEYFPYKSGFVSLEETPHLAGNGCENCHGPAGAHVEAERGKDIVRQEQLRATMRLTKLLAEENLCNRCHDLDNSPNFAHNFAQYWSKIEHKGKR